jgi:hypothetical protein
MTDSLFLNLVMFSRDTRCPFSINEYIAVTMLK